MARESRLERKREILASRLAGLKEKESKAFLECYGLEKVGADTSALRKELNSISRQADHLRKKTNRISGKLIKRKYYPKRKKHIAIALLAVMLALGSIFVLTQMSGEVPQITGFATGWGAEGPGNIIIEDHGTYYEMWCDNHSINNNIFYLANNGELRSDDVNNYWAKMSASIHLRKGATWYNTSLKDITWTLKEVQNNNTPVARVHFFGNKNGQYMDVWWTFNNSNDYLIIRPRLNTTTTFDDSYFIVNMTEIKINNTANNDWVGYYNTTGNHKSYNLTNPSLSGSVDESEVQNNYFEWKDGDTDKFAWLKTDIAGQTTDTFYLKGGYYPTAYTYAESHYGAMAANQLYPILYHWSDPTNVLIDANAEATATATEGTFTGGKNIIKLNSGRLISYWESDDDDPSCEDSTDSGATWNGINSEAVTFSDVGIATNGTHILYFARDTANSDTDFIYRVTGVCDISSGTFDDIGSAASTSNDHYRSDPAFDGSHNRWISAQIDDDDSDVDFTYIAVAQTMAAGSWTGVAAISGATTTDSVSVDVADNGNVFVAADDSAASTIKTYNSSTGVFGTITTTTAYAAAVRDMHLSIRGNIALITAVDTAGSDLVVAWDTNVYNGVGFTSAVLAGTYTEAEGCIDSNGDYQIIVSDGSDLYYVNYIVGTGFGAPVKTADTANALRYPSVRCTNFPAGNRMTDGVLEYVYTEQTDTNIYFDAKTYTPRDLAKPKVPGFGVANNTASIYNGDWINWWTIVRDNAALSAYKFRTNATVGNVWTNQSWSGIAGTGALSGAGPKNVTFNFTIAAAAGTYVCGEFYVNDTSNNWNHSVDYSAANLGLLNNSICFTITAANTPPGKGSTYYPDGAEHITDRTPELQYNNVTDAEGNPLYYYIQLDNENGFNAPLVWSVGNGATKTWQNTTVPFELNLDTTYYWRVLAYDGTVNGTWSDTATFTVDSSVVISLPTNSVNFGSLGLGATDDTSDGNPAPVDISNDGNCALNISFESEDIWATVANPSANYRFKVREHEANSYKSAEEAWINVLLEGSRYDYIIIKLFYANTTNTANTAYLDLLLLTPNEEPPVNLAGAALNVSAWMANPQ